jgi:hypothetical protein
LWGRACFVYVVGGLAGTVVVVVVVVVVVDVVEVVDVVVVVVVVAGGITKPFAHPHRISIGAPIGVPIALGTASIARRNWAHPSHAEIPVVGHPPRTWLHAAV